jgi:HEAT repeat protein
MGQSYLQSLFSMLKAGTVKLDEVSEGLSNLPTQYNQQVENLLNSSDRHDQILGLELATRVTDPSIFIPQIEGLLFGKDEAVRVALVKFLSYVSNPIINSYLTKQLNSENYLLQLISLESLIANKYGLKSNQLRQLLRKSFMKTIDKLVEAQERSKKKEQIDSILLANNQLKALICLAISQSESNDNELNKACNLIWHSEIDTGTKLSVIRTIKRTGDRNFIPLVKQFITDKNTTTNIKREGLDTLANLANSQDNDLAKIAVNEITNSDPLVRAAAFKLLGVIRDPNLLEKVALGLENNNLAVRLWSATALANYGEKCLKIAEKYLYSPRLEVVEAAIAVLAKVQTRKAIKIINNYLKPDYELVSKTLIWLKEIPAYQYPWNLIKIILEDSQQKLFHRVLYVISRLDHQASLNNIQHILQTKDIRLRANAIETLSSFKYRDFILPILPLLEHTESSEKLISENPTFNKESFLEYVSNTHQTWLNIAAILVLFNQNKKIPDHLINNSDSVVTKVATYFNNPVIDTKTDFFLHRIFFLKKVTLLEKLFLDELLLVNNFLEESKFLAGTTICNSNTFLNDLLIIYRGNTIIYQENQTQEVYPGQYFGEMALFDYAPLSVTMIAKTNCTILTLSREKFNQLLELCPRLLLCYSHSC